MTTYTVMLRVSDSMTAEFKLKPPQGSQSVTPTKHMTGATCYQLANT